MRVKLPASATGYVVLGVGALALVFVVVKWGIPALTKAATDSTKRALNDASTLPAAAVTATGNAVGSTLDALGGELLGQKTYNAIPDTWGGVWSDVKGWFGGSTTSAPGARQGGPSTAPTSVANAANDVLGAPSGAGSTSVDVGLVAGGF